LAVNGHAHYLHFLQEMRNLLFSFVRVIRGQEILELLRVLRGFLIRVIRVTGKISFDESMQTRRYFEGSESAKKTGGEGGVGGVNASKKKYGFCETVRQLLLQEVKRKTAFENDPGATFSIQGDFFHGKI